MTRLHSEGGHRRPSDSAHPKSRHRGPRRRLGRARILGERDFVWERSGLQSPAGWLMGDRVWSRVPLRPGRARSRAVGRTPGPSGSRPGARKVISPVLLVVWSFCQVWESWPFPRGPSPSFVEEALGLAGAGAFSPPGALFWLLRRVNREQNSSSVQRGPRLPFASHRGFGCALGPRPRSLLWTALEAWDSRSTVVPPGLPPASG